MTGSEDDAAELSSTTASSPTVMLSPTAARRRLGGDLRQLRESARLTLAEVGRRIQRSQATMTRVEKGAAPLRIVDVEKLLDIYRDAGVAQAEDVRGDLLDLLAAGREKEWFSPFRDVLSGDMTSDHIETLVSYETDAERIVSFEPDLVPGPLQTRSYATAVIESYFPDRPGGQRERLVDFRMERGERVRRLGRPQLDLVIGENALLRGFGGGGTMAEQLRSIADEIRDGTPNISITILPGAVALPAAIGGPFTVIHAADPLDSDVVYLEHRDGASYLTSDADVAHYGTQFADLTGAALDREASLRHMEELAARFA